MKDGRSFVISLLTLLLAACGPRPDAAEEFIGDFMRTYPKATLQDIYKGCFQDVFGPGHILTDRATVEHYIRQELERTDEAEAEDYRPCSWRENFYRVNLSVIRDGKVTMDDFVEAFMASADGIDTTRIETWQKEWATILQKVKATVPRLEGFAEDSARIARLLQAGNPVLHHSRTFNALYHPHYRIIRKNLFEEKILPKLKRD